MSLVNAGTSSTATFGRGMLSFLISKFQHVVFNVCAKEVGRIQSSSILRVLFVASSALASILAFSTLLSPKSYFGFLIFAIAECSINYKMNEAFSRNN